MQPDLGGSGACPAFEDLKVRNVPRGEVARRDTYDVANTTQPTASANRAALFSPKANRTRVKEIDRQWSPLATRHLGSLDS